MSERTPLLADNNRRYVCPSCERVLRIVNTPRFGWLRCPNCRTTFLCSETGKKKALTLALSFFICGLICLVGGIGLAVYTYDLHDQNEYHYVWYYGLPICGVLFMIRAFVLYIRVRRALTPQRTFVIQTEFAAARDGNVGTLENALRNGFQVDSLSPEGATCLQYASQKGQLEVVHFLLRNNANPNAGTTRSSPLLEAVAAGHLEIAEVLVSAGANEHAVCSATSRAGAPVEMNLLTLACSKGHAHIIRWLLVVRQHPPNIKSVGCDYPLHIATRSDRVDIIRMLCTAGAAMNAQNSHGLTALHVAVVFTRMNALHELLSVGADPTLVSRSGQTPETLALKQDKTALVRVFQDHRTRLIQATMTSAERPENSGGSVDLPPPYTPSEQSPIDPSPSYPRREEENVF